MVRIWTQGLCPQSWALEPLDQGALLSFHFDKMFDFFYLTGRRRRRLDRHQSRWQEVFDAEGERRQVRRPLRRRWAAEASRRRGRIRIEVGSRNFDKDFAGQLLFDPNHEGRTYLHSLTSKLSNVRFLRLGTSWELLRSFTHFCVTYAGWQLGFVQETCSLVDLSPIKCTSSYVIVKLGTNDPYITALVVLRAKQLFMLKKMGQHHPLFHFILAFFLWYSTEN